ncbi:MAG TPA: GTPase-associated protein 1-related protein [Mycobacteriales bacterium]|nr:GTPase-associated protein 1-related protein [Mycobacteriales bacterium]
MTGRFETLVYTDCRPGQGLRGSAGLQFQARSAGADIEAMALVQRTLLYEPPASWMQHRRPVTDYPPSFAHVSGGLWATAHGVYLGQEANGTREGNQLTHTVVTKDPDSYGLVRPAQLFGASFWTSQPVDGNTCPPVGEGWEPGPFDAASIQEFVRRHPRHQELLGTLVSTLERIREPQARRLLFVAEQVEPVLRWLAAATLLLPQRQALEIGFKVFTTNPAYAAQPVLAVHPDWDSFPGTVDRDLGYVVVDLVADRWSEVPVSPTAGIWAELFSVEDPYDVTDAVEVAAASGLPPEVAQQLALAAVLSRQPAGEHALAVVSWLADGPRDLLNAYGVALVDVLTDRAGSQPVSLLRALARVVRAGGRSAAVRLALLAAEVREAAVQGATSATAVPLPASGEWDEKHAATARRIVAEGLEVTRGVGFDAVLRVARTFDVAVSMEQNRAATEAFVRDWLDHPDRPYDPASWPDGDRFVDLLCDLLSQQVEREPARAAEVGARWWRQLLPYRGEPRNECDAAVLATAMAQGTEAERSDLVAERLRLACQDRNPAGGVERLAAVLWTRTIPTMAELELLHRYARQAGAYVAPALIDSFVVAERHAGRLDDDVLDLCRRFRDDSVVRRPGGELTRLLDDDARVRELCRVLGGPTEATAEVDDLRGVSLDAILRRRRDLAAALRRAGPRLALAALLSLPAEVAEAYVARLAAALRQEPVAPDLATAFCLREPDETGRPSSSGVSRALGELLRSWVRRASEGDLDEVAEWVCRLGGADRRTDWRAWAHGERGNRWRWRRRR